MTRRVPRDDKREGTSQERRPGPCNGKKKGPLQWKEEEVFSPQGRHCERSEAILGVGLRSGLFSRSHLLFIL